MSDAFTPRNAAKYIVKAIVHRKAAQFTEDVLIDYTRYEEDDLVVDLGSHLVGWYVSDKLKPHTDRAVDFVADKAVAYRQKRNATTPTE